MAYSPYLSQIFEYRTHMSREAFTNHINTSIQIHDNGNMLIFLEMRHELLDGVQQIRRLSVLVLGGEDFQLSDGVDKHL